MNEVLAPDLNQSNSHSSDRVYIFKPQYERLYLGLVAFSLIFCAANFVTGFGKESLGTEWMRFFVYFLCFNYLHVILTFVGLAALPEMRKWLRHQLSLPRFFFFGSVVAIVLYIGAVRFVNIDKATVSGELLIGIYALLVSMHNISQTKGLSLLYNRLVKPSLTAEEAQKAKRIETFERIGFNAMLVFNFAYILIRWLRPEYWKSDVFASFAFGIGLMAIVVISNSIRYPKAFRSNKVYFLSSTLIYAFIPVLPLASLMNRALHGCEYIFLADRMVDNSKVKWSRATLALTIVPLFLFAILYSFDWRFIPQVAQLIPRNWITPIISVVIWFEYLHYYLDGVMFRFSDPVVRANIGPLIFPDEK